MSIGALALKYCNVNDFAAAAPLELVQGNGGTYFVQLVQLKSGLRYLPAAGSTVTILFSRSQSIAAAPANQDVTATLTAVDGRDASLFQFTLSAAQVDKIVSGGARLQITESGVTKSYPLDNFVRRRSSAPGA